MVNAVNRLNSKYYIKRDKARAALDKNEKSAISLCIQGFDTASELGKAQRLDLLSPRIWDDRLNHLAWICLEAEEAALRFSAIKYLSAHPEKKNQKFIDWTQNLLSCGSGFEKSAYFLGMRKPAPAFQTRLVCERIGLNRGSLLSLGLESLIKGWRNEACSSLASLIRQMEAGQVDPRYQIKAMHLLAKIATPEACPVMLRGLVSASYDLGKEASQVAQQMIGHLYRAREYPRIISLHRAIAAAAPARIHFALDHADSLIQYQPGSEAAIEVLQGIERSLCGKQGTENRILLEEIRMGLCAAHHGRAEGLVEPVTLDPVDPEVKKQGYALRRVMARRELLRGSLAIVQGRDGRDAFRSALEVAPYDPDFAEIDAIFTGRFSISNLIWRLNQAGRESGSRAIFRSLVQVLREDRSGSTYFPPPEESAYSNDRTRSALPLNEAYFLLHNCGDPAEAFDRLKDFIESIKDSSLFSNRDLLARAYYFQALASADLGRAKEAVSIVKKGIKVYEALVEDLKECWRNTDVDAAEEYYKKERSRGLLYLATFIYYFFEDAEESAKHGRKAVLAAPEFDAPIITRAIQQARRGEYAPARDLLANMEPYPDRYYNFACLHALTGKMDEAVAYLEKHLTEYLPPMRKKIERGYIAKDPDLKSLMENEAFIRLIRTEN